jgi:enamine deaminase RidA (YjgF/YER057c/UK114 family)
VKLPLFGLSFEFVRLDGSSRCVACGGNSIIMGPSMSQHCWLTTSERYLERRSGRRHSYALQIHRTAFPAMALVEVSRLVEAQALVEIEATAVLP